MAAWLEFLYYRLENRDSDFRCAKSVSNLLLIYNYYNLYKINIIFDFLGSPKSMKFT